nr:MAG TPA: hypothetical protein [Caudoviricetes sp.]
MTLFNHRYKVINISKYSIFCKTRFFLLIF